MTRIVLVFLALVSSTFAVSSVWSSLASAGSQALVTGLKNSPDADAIKTALSQPNITLFLPSSAAIEAAVQSNLLNFNQTANTTLNQILRHIIPGNHSSTALLNKRQYLLTPDPLSATLPLVVGPHQQNSSMLQVASGVVTGTVIQRDIVCSNGIIHLIDQFLQRPLSALGTVEYIPELESYELLMKSLNLTSIVSGQNKTVFAPINNAWTAANASSISYGTLVYTLKYEVVDGMYTRDALFYQPQDVSLQTNRIDAALTFHRQSNSNPNQDVLQVMGLAPTDIAHVVQSDIITTDGIFHLVDLVLYADETAVAGAAGAGTGSEGGSPGNVPPSHPSYSALSAEGMSTVNSQASAVPLGVYSLCASVTVMLVCLHAMSLLTH